MSQHPSSDDPELATRNSQPATNRLIIVAEDGEGLNVLVCRRLERHGLATVGVLSGADAIAAVEKHPDCLLLLDLVLPDMDGRKVVEELIARGRPVPFIVMTGHGDEQVAVEMMKLGARDYVVKQDDFTDLLVPVVERTLAQLATKERLAASEAALRESEKRLRAIAGAANDAIVMMDDSGLVTFWNPAAEATFGYTAGEVMGRKLHEFLVPERFQAAHAAAFGRFRTTGEGGAIGKTVELAATRKDGSEIPAELSLSAIKIGDRWHGVGIVRDITERKQAEAELAKYRDHLEELVQARTQALELANKELEAFSYSVSHDLRAPLRAINGFARTLQEEYAAQLDPVAHGYLDRVNAASRDMGELIDNLLNLARVARQPLQRKPVDLSELARTITGELRKAGPARQVELVIPDGMTAQADPVLAGILLRNLLDNAWKFTGKHPTARIEVGETVRDGEPVWFVRDDGAGFDMAYVDNLSKPFQRLHGPADFAGTGIGLATAQRIVRRHGGRGWIEGKVEKGATFYFTFATATREV